MFMKENTITSYKRKDMPIEIMLEIQIEDE